MMVVRARVLAARGVEEEETISLAFLVLPGASAKSAPVPGAAP